MEEILQMSALELSKQIRHGSVSVKEAVEACKKQIQKSESQVHAYVSMDEKILAHRIKEVEEGIKSGRYIKTKIRKWRERRWKENRIVPEQ